MHCISKEASIRVLQFFCVLTTAAIKGKNLVSKMHLSAPPPCGCGYCPSKGGDYFCGYFIICCPCFVIQYFVSLIVVQSSCYICGSFVFFSVWCLLCLVGVCLCVPCGRLPGRGWPLGSLCGVRL